MANGPPDDSAAGEAAKAVPGPLRLQHTLRGHTRAVATVKISPVDDDLLASGSADKTVRLWRLGKEQEAGTPGGLQHDQGVNDVAWNPHGNLLASVSDDTVVRMWDAETGTCLRSLQGHTNYAYCCQFDPAGRVLATGSFDETIRFWDVRTGRLLRETPAHSDPVTALCFSFDGTMLISGSFDGLVRVWDARNGHCLKSYASSSNSAPVNDVMLSRNAKYYLQATLDSHLRLINVETGRCAKTYSGHKSEDFCCGATFMAGLPAAADQSDTAAAMETDTAEEQAAGAQGSGGLSVAVASGSEDGSLFVWDLNSRKLIQRELGAAAGGQGHLAAALCITAHPTRALVVTGGQEVAREREEGGGQDRGCEIKVWATA